MKEKIKNRRGESTAELLAAFFVISMGLFMLAQAVSGGRNMQKISSERLTEIYEEINSLEMSQAKGAAPDRAVTEVRQFSLKGQSHDYSGTLRLYRYTDHDIWAFSDEKPEAEQ